MTVERFADAVCVLTQLWVDGKATERQCDLVLDVMLDLARERAALRESVARQEVALARGTVSQQEI